MSGSMLSHSFVVGKGLEGAHGPFLLPAMIEVSAVGDEVGLREKRGRAHLRRRTCPSLARFCPCTCVTSRTLCACRGTWRGSLCRIRSTPLVRTTEVRACGACRACGGLKHSGLIKLISTYGKSISTYRKFQICWACLRGLVGHHRERACGRELILDATVE